MCLPVKYRPTGGMFLKHNHTQTLRICDFFSLTSLETTGSIILHCWNPCVYELSMAGFDSPEFSTPAACHSLPFECVFSAIAKGIFFSYLFVWSCHSPFWIHLLTIFLLCFMVKLLILDDKTLCNLTDLSISSFSSSAHSLLLLLPYFFPLLLLTSYHPLIPQRSFLAFRDHSQASFSHFLLSWIIVPSSIG